MIKNVTNFYLFYEYLFELLSILIKYKWYFFNIFKDLVLKMYDDIAIRYFKLGAG